MFSPLEERMLKNLRMLIETHEVSCAGQSCGISGIDEAKAILKDAGIAWTDYRQGA